MKEVLVFIVFPRPCKVAGCRWRSGAPATPRPPPPTYRWAGVGRGRGGKNRAGSRRACRPPAPRRVRRWRRKRDGRGHAPPTHPPRPPRDAAAPLPNRARRGKNRIPTLRPMMARTAKGPPVLFFAPAPRSCKTGWRAPATAAMQMRGI